MSTPSVREVLRAASAPAKRPIDNIRRVGSGLFVGNCVGTAIGVFIYGGTINSLRLLVVCAVLLCLSFVFLSPWLVRTREAGGKPVVARALWTQESVESRLSRWGLRIPVVAKRVDSGQTFRTFLVIDKVGSADYADPEPGTLYAVRQVREGMGDLARVDSPTPEQMALLERLRKHPKEMSNTAPILPIQRSPLSFTPAWSGAVLVSATLAGVGIAIALVSVVAS